MLLTTTITSNLHLLTFASPLHSRTTPFISHLHFPSRHYVPQTIYFLCPRNPRTSVVQAHTPNLSEEQQEGVQGGGEEEGEEEFQVLTAIKTCYNDIVIVDTPKSRFLLLDSTHNVHSMFNKEGDNWTGSYWDEFAALTAIIPDGLTGIYGLGAGTAARLMLDVRPSLRIVGWEIDGILIEMAREFLGLAEIEMPNSAGGVVEVRIGDVFKDEVPEAKYAGIVIDLFSAGKVLGDLEKVETWVELKGRLVPGGRIMVNCAGGDNDGNDDGHHGGTWGSNATIRAMWEAFPGELSWKKMPMEEGKNYLALTGKTPDLDSWSSMVSGRLSKSVREWRACG